MANAVTKRDILTKAQGLDVWTDEEREVIAKMIGQLDKKSSKPTKAQVANEGIKAEIEYPPLPPTSLVNVPVGISSLTIVG